jgi:hypothetical protein
MRHLEHYYIVRLFGAPETRGRLAFPAAGLHFVANFCSRPPRTFGLGTA